MLEMVVAMVVMMIGLLALASSIGYALSVTNMGRNVTNTKLLILSVTEQIETLRNSEDMTFGQIANTGAVDNTGGKKNFAGFATGFRPVSTSPGPDGIYGTTDDLVDRAGPDGQFGTNDDIENPLLKRQGYEREIVIRPLSGYLKQIEVTIRYPGGDGKTRTLTGISYLNNDSRSNTIR